jgi:hypothetical protein
MSGTAPPEHLLTRIPLQPLGNSLLLLRNGLRFETKHGVSQPPTRESQRIGLLSQRTTLVLTRMSRQFERLKPILLRNAARRLRNGVERLRMEVESQRQEGQRLRIGPESQRIERLSRHREPHRLRPSPRRGRREDDSQQQAGDSQRLEGRRLRIERARPVAVCSPPPKVPLKAAPLLGRDGMAHDRLDLPQHHPELRDRVLLIGRNGYPVLATDHELVT